MKKILLSAALILSVLTINAQETLENTNSTSKAIEFSKKDGIFLKKEQEEIGTIDKINFTNIYLENVLTKEKTLALKLQSSMYTSAGMMEYSGTLDSDELDACIQSLTYIKESCIGTVPELYTEMIYRTRDGVKIGAYYDVTNKKNQWTIFIQTSTMTYRSLNTIKEENLQKVIDLFIEAKNKMK